MGGGDEGFEGFASIWISSWAIGVLEKGRRVFLQPLATGTGRTHLRQELICRSDGVPEAIAVVYAQ